VTPVEYWARDGLGVHPAPLGRNKKVGKIGLSGTASESKNLWGLASSVSEEINSFASLEEFVLLKIYDATKAEEWDSTATPMEALTVRSGVYIDDN